MVNTTTKTNMFIDCMHDSESTRIVFKINKCKLNVKRDELIISYNMQMRFLRLPQESPCYPRISLRHGYGPPKIETSPSLRPEAAESRSQTTRAVSTPLRGRKKNSSEQGRRKTKKEKEREKYINSSQNYVSSRKVKEPTKNDTRTTSKDVGESKWRHIP